jgi:hypothetical protein
MQENYLNQSVYTCFLRHPLEAARRVPYEHVCFRTVCKKCSWLPSPWLILVLFSLVAGIAASIGGIH